MRNYRTNDDSNRGTTWGPESGMAALRGLLGAPDRSQRMGRGDVRTAILQLLAERPMHGYQLINEIQQRSAGGWRPSPGSVYPTLQLLVDEGLLSVDETGERKVYSVTEAGRQAATAQASSADEQPMRRAAERASALPRAGLKLAQTLTQFGPDTSRKQMDQAVQVVEEARRKLYTILAEG